MTGPPGHAPLSDRLATAITLVDVGLFHRNIQVGGPRRARLFATFAPEPKLRLHERRPGLARRLSNNVILLKLRIALNLRDEGILELLELAGRHISKHELSAFFRKPEHRQYRECQDQILRNFLMGMQRKFRPGAPDET